MKIKIYSFLVLSIIFLNSTSAQVSSHSPNRQINRSVKQQITGSPVHQFTSLWKQVDSLVNLGQPRSALDIVNKIYLQAKTENNDQQVIKAIIYRIRLNSDYQENFLTSTILELQNEIQIARQPAKQVLQSIIAEVYWKYYQNNQYRFRGRTQVKANITDSIETYDPGTIFRMITRSYMLSLNNADSLKRIPVGQFEAILDCDVFDDKKTEIQVAEAAKFIPTLYDFLADRALEFFTSNHQVYTIPVQHFEIDQEWYFDQTIDFTGKQMLFPADSAAPSSFAMRIFHDLATFHFKDKDPRALISVELKRFAFVNREYTLSGKDSLFINALWQFDQGQIGSPWGTSISYMLADYLNTCGQQYKPLVSSLHKWEIRSAAELCEKAIRRFPESEGANNCKILVKTIKSPTLRITTESAVPCEKPSLAMVEFKNINQLFFRMVKADPDSFNEKSGILDQSEFFKFLLSLPTIRSWSQNFPNDGDYQEHRTEISLPEVPNGFWVLMCAASKDFSDPKQVFSFIPFWSTQISYISKRNEDGSFGYFILDRETGMPLKNAKAEVWEKTYDYRERQYSAIKLQDYISDGQGFFLISPSDNNKRNSNLFLKIRYKEDFLITDNFYQYPVYAGQTKTSLQTMFYTDRAIYRPGQNVYFKGILLEKTGDKSKIKINHTTKVTFTDANGQKISEQTLTSNEFGSFNGSFSVPLGVLLGQMTISNESGSVGFSVEEYKRPTFEVACDQLEGNYRLGETITVTARAVAFAGNAIDGATVKYRVVRSASFPFWDRAWRRPMQASPQAEITSGNAFTDSTGKYSFTFKAIPDPTTDKETRPVFDFTIYADVTDINGETQSVQQTVSVGYNAMLIGINITEIVNLAKDSAFKISTTNLNGLSTPSIVTVTLQKLNQPDRSFISRSWECPDIAIMTRDEFYSRHPFNIYGNENDPETWTKGETIIEKTINTQTDSILKIEGSGYGIKLPGSYLLVLKATDPFGVVVEKKQFFTAFSPVSKEVPINTINWFVPMKTMGEPGENARFLIGSKEDNVQVIYEIRLHDSLVSREIIKLNDRAMVFEIPIREQYRGNFAVNFMFIKHNRAFQNSQLVNVPYTNKKLGIAFETFRNKLDPGSRESWKIRISGANEKPAHAEFLATMYDASLDQFRSNEWSFNLYQRYSGINPWDIDNSFRTSSGQWIVSNYGNENFSFQPALQLNWFGLNYFGRSGRYLRSSSGGMDKSSGMIMMERSPNAGIQASEMLPPSERNEVAPNVGDPAIVVDPANVSKGGRNAPKSQAGTAIKIRQNFQETAFFNPTIVTDSAGILILQFTAPESLTKWKMLGLAHTKNLDYGMIEKELITRKDLMVFPNTPRFVRQADTVIFSAKIVNLSDRELSGGVNLDLCDAITSQSLNSWIDTTWKYEMGTRNSGTRNQHFDAKTNQSVLVSWKLFIPISSNHSVLQLRITAVSGNFSDGEEKAIPILTNRMMVTESLPLPVRGKGTTEFSFDKLLKSDSPGQNIATLKNYRLTLEFASSPSWYAIQALPGLNDRKYENADAVFSAFWSNNIAAFIANSNPKIKAVFESWKKLTPDALKSNLSKNQELKTALLQETPWVMDATSEAERKQKLGLYFDLNNIEANLSENLVKLKKLQAPNGGWTWFAGMPENRWITQTIIAGMGHLDRLGVISIRKDPETWNMIVKGIRFLDSELIKDFESLKKQDSGFRNNNQLSATQIQYLYSRSYFMNDPRLLIPDPGEKFRESFNFYKKQAEKYWMHYDRYLQGMIALALNSLENKEVPALIIKSLSEKALHSNEMGMYWAGEPGFLWYQAPIETQALMIEVFDEIARDEKAVEDLKIWLLKQKQSQDWRSSRATLEACYSLLLRGTDLLSEEPGVKISIGREKINSDKLIDKDKEAGTGYFQVSWSGNQITSEMGRVSITKSTQGVAWGALYWQYFENLDKITPAATPMKLEKKLFVENNTPSGPVLVPIMPDLKPGSIDEPNSNSPDYPVTRSLKTGDKLKARIILTVDRNLEFVHMKDMRASALEPYQIVSVNSSSGIHNQTSSGDGLSGYRYQDGLGYYQSTTDQATNFFFEYLPKGTYVFEYALKINSAGDYSNGITTIQCMYAPEFAAHSEGIRIRID